MYTYESSLTVSNCVFSDNRVDGTAYGLGRLRRRHVQPEQRAHRHRLRLHVQSGRRHPRARVLWGRGGGMYNYGYYYGSYLDENWPRVTGCTFSGNIAYAAW